MSSFSDKYELVVGLEIHVQLNTGGKIFSPEENSFAAGENSETHPVSLAHPGTLPRLHPEVVRKAITLGLALDCKIAPFSFFDRKNYFYPDLPKGYQISQDSDPICIGGLIELEGEEAGKMIRLHHIHMEEDAGKSMHSGDGAGGFSKIDLNRAGTPLLEIVTEPDFRSPNEAASCLEQLQHLVRYLGVSNADMEKGHLRCDANVSVRPFGQLEYGTRAEVKNLNSMKFVKKAIEFEFKRQCQLLEDGKSVVQETRGFDPATGVTSSQRKKEMAQDYRYFPDPDLAPFECTETLLKEIKSQLPEQPKIRRKRYQEQWQLSEYDARLLVQERSTADFFDIVLKEVEAPKLTANWLLNDVKAFLTTGDHPALREEDSRPFAKIVKATQEEKLSMHLARTEVLPRFLADRNSNIDSILAETEQHSNKNENFAAVLAKQIIDQFPKETELYRGGKKKLLGMFMGEMMKASKGKIDPKEAKKKILEELEK